MQLKLSYGGILISLLILFSLFISVNSKTTFDYHPFWSGYEIDLPNVTDVTASWVVPAQSGNGASAQWVGIGGNLESNLIQIGTRYINSNYSAWLECTGQYQCTFLPFQNAESLNQVVEANDKMKAEIKRISQNTWNLSITDLTHPWTHPSETTVDYTPNNQSFEFVEEFPQHCYVTIPLIGARYDCDSMSDFGHAEFGPD